MRQILRSPAGLAGVILVALLVVLAVIGPMVWGTRAAHIDPESILEGSSGQHPLGTDSLGRDILARVLVAGRLSLVLALLATLIGVVVGVPLGVLPAVLPPALGRSVTGTVNALVAFPGLLLAMFTSIVLGLGARGAVFGIGIATAPALARLTLTLTMSVAGSDYVAAARMLRVPRRLILTRHILPNVAEPLILNITMIMGSTLLGLAGLSFLGLGVQPPQYDWGRMLSDGLGRVYIDPEVALGPAVAIMLAGVGFNLLGERMARVAARTSSATGRKAPTVDPVAADAVAAGLTEAVEPSDSAPAPARAPSPVPVPGSVTTLHSGLERAGYETRVEPERTGDVLELVGLTVDFPGAGTPVRDVSLWVNAGEIVGIVGESGCGKSLTTLALGGLVPYPGTVSVTRHTLAGTDLSTLNPAARHRLLGTSLAMVFQDPMAALNPALRVGTQLAEVSTVHGGLSRRDARRRAVERLTRVRIPEPARRARQRPHQYSGGMRQRAVIAMGTMGTPRLLVADEPTTALDVTVQRQILELLQEVVVGTEAGALFISHDIAVVSQICHRVVVMYAGRVVEELPVEDLVAGPAHPYTRALVASLPDMHIDRERPLATIPGRPPAPDAEPPGCPFADRCALADATCATTRPPLVASAEGRRVACWHPQSGPVRATEDLR